MSITLEDVKTVCAALIGILKEEIEEKEIDDRDLEVDIDDEDVEVSLITDVYGRCGDVVDQEYQSIYVSFDKILERCIRQ